MMKRNLPLLLGVILLAVGPLAFRRESSTFGGSDDQATEMITKIQPGYHRWAEPLWKPPSPEIESLIFAVQAALGAGVLGYYFGKRRGYAEGKSESGRHAPH